MFEPVESEPPEGQAPQEVGQGNSVLKYVVGGLACIYVIASMFFFYTLKNRLDSLEQREQSVETAQADLGARLHATKSEFREALSSEVGLTKQQLAQRAAELERQQRAAEAKLKAEQSQQGQRIAAVSGEVSGVKTELGGARTDIQKTQSDLQATNAKLEHAIGDLGLQSGLIAHTREELEVLKHRGDRNYYDFTLQKGSRTPISTVSLQLKKVDAKKGKFTLNVIADDRTIEKKDRTLNEPLQFYTGRDHMLYELVVFTAAKNTVSGYLATPKTAPQPVTP